MAERRDILWRFLGDAKSLNKASKSAGKSLGGVQGAMGGLTKAAGTLGIGLGAAGLARGMGDAIMRAQEMDSKYAITKQVLEDTGYTAGLTEDDIRDLSREMSNVTGLDKGVALDAANVLLTFKDLKGVTGDMDGEFERALRLTGDMAAVFGGSAKDAAKQLGKALQDPVTGLGALSRVGVQFTKDQKDVITSLVEMGDSAGAQQIILAELESQVGGTAEASADATSKIANQWKELQEGFGAELLEALGEISGSLEDTGDGASTLGKTFAKQLKRIGNVESALDLVALAGDDTASALDLAKGASNFLTGSLGYLHPALGRTVDQLHIGIETGATFDRKIRDIALSNQVWRDAQWEAQGAVKDTSDEMIEQKKIYDEYRLGIQGIYDAAVLAAAGIRQIPSLEDLEDQYHPPGTPGGGGGTAYNHAGGVVSGLAGTNQLRVLQAGERVIPRGGGDGGGGVNITVNMGVVGDPDSAAQAIADLMTRYETTAGTRRTGIV